jgi:hypothetical protein
MPGGSIWSARLRQLHVGSALIFEGPPPSQTQLASAIECRLDLVPRYRQRVQQVPLELGRPVWVDDPRFCIDGHVRHATLPSPGTEESLRDWVALPHVGAPGPVPASMGKLAGRRP